MDRRWTLIVLLVIISPVFGVYLAAAVGYHEPLDLAAEKLGLREATERTNWTPFLDYRVPGLPDWLGYIVSGFMGVALVAALGYALAKHLGGGEGAPGKVP